MLPPSSGTIKFSALSAKVIRFTRYGCTNRPFYHIVVAERHKEQFEPVIEQVGSYDPLPNERNEKLVSLNLERIAYWIGNGAHISRPVEQLLGLSGFLPIHPTTYMAAWKNRQIAETAAKQATEAASSSNTDTKSN